MASCREQVCVFVIQKLFRRWPETCLFLPVVAKEIFNKTDERDEIMEPISKTETKKHKGGRPKKVIKRTCILVLRLTSTELMLIKGKAKEAGHTPSSWVRQASKRASIVARLTPADIGHLRMLAGVANNLNQMTHLAHKEGLLYHQRNCREVVSKISELLNKLNSDDRKSHDR